MPGRSLARCMCHVPFTGVALQSAKQCKAPLSVAVSPLNMLVPSLVAIALAYCGSARGARYNFDDVYFNRALLDQMDDYFMPWRESYINDPNPQLRRRMKFRNEICCGSYVVPNMLREDRVRDQCFDRVFNSSGRAQFVDEWNYFNTDQAPIVAESLICLQQCLWKLRGTFDNRYDPFTGLLRRTGRRRLPDDGNFNFPEKAVVKCLPGINPERPTLFGGGSGECKRDYLDFSYCVWEEMHADCPDKLWDFNNLWCIETRRYLLSRRYSK